MTGPQQALQDYFERVLGVRHILRASAQAPETGHSEPTVSLRSPLCCLLHSPLVQGDEPRRALLKNLQKALGTDRLESGSARELLRDKALRPASWLCLGEEEARQLWPGPEPLPRRGELKELPRGGAFLWTHGLSEMQRNPELKREVWADMQRLMKSWEK